MGAQPGAHPRHDLLGLEGLDDVVVGAALQAEHDVDRVALGGEHDDRHAALGPDLPAHLEAVGAGQHEVEQHDVGPLPPERAERRVAVRDDGRLEPLAAQHDAEHLGERRVVVHHEHAALHGQPRPAAAGTAVAWLHRRTCGRVRAGSARAAARALLRRAGRATMDARPLPGGRRRRSPVSQDEGSRGPRLVGPRREPPARRVRPVAAGRPRRTTGAPPTRHRPAGSTSSSTRPSGRAGAGARCRRRPAGAGRRPRWPAGPSSATAAASCRCARSVSASCSTASVAVVRGYPRPVFALGAVVAAAGALLELLVLLTLLRPVLGGTAPDGSLHRDRRRSWPARSAAPP